MDSKQNGVKIVLEVQFRETGKRFICSNSWYENSMFGKSSEELLTYIQMESPYDQILMGM